MKVNKIKTRKMANSFKIALMIAITALAVGLLMFLIARRMLFNSLLEVSRNQTLDVAKMAANAVDGDQFERVIQNGYGEDFEEVKKDLTDFLEGETVLYVYTYAKNAQGKVFFVVDSDPEEPADFGDEADDQEEVESALKGTPMVSEEPVTDEWATAYNAYAPIRNSAGKIVGVVGVDLDAGTADKMVSRSDNSILIGLMGAIVIAAGSGFYFGFRQKAVYEKINSAVEEVASDNGDLTQRIEIKTGDEMEVIANNLNKLLQKTQETIADTKSGNENVNEMMKSIASDMVASTKSVESANADLQSIAASGEEITANIETAGDVSDALYKTTEEVRSIVEKNADAIREINEKSGKLYKLAEESTGKAHDNIGKMKDELEKEKGKALAVEKIQALSSSILDIAQQTNLLSLNASIEAARAGEAGRGFAVVATEISKLAEDSSHAATEIQQVSAEVNEAITGFLSISDGMIDVVNEMVENDYVSFMESSSEFSVSAENISKDMHDMNDKMGAVFESIGTIKSSISEITVASDQNTQDIIGCSEMVGNLDKIIRTTTDIAEKTAQTVEKMDKTLSSYKV